MAFNMIYPLPPTALPYKCPSSVILENYFLHGDLTGGPATYKNSNPLVRAIVTFSISVLVPKMHLLTALTIAEQSPLHITSALSSKYDLIVHFIYQLHKFSLLYIVCVFPFYF